MRHLDDGALRRLYDEPGAVAAADQAHLAACPRCRGAYARVEADATAAAGLLTATTMPPARVDPDAALRRVRRQIAAPAPRLWPLRLPLPRRQLSERTIPMYQYNSRRLARPAGGLVAAAALVAALALTPAGALAAQLLTVFEPQQFAAVPVTNSDLQGLRNLPNLSSYGTMGQGRNPTTRSYASVAEAARAAGQAVRQPASLPVGVPTTATYTVMSPGVASFTFDAAKARAAATKDGKPLPPMPAGLDGSTLQLTVGPIVVATYGGNLPGAARPETPADRGATKGGAGARSAAAQVRKNLRPRAAVAQAGAADEIPALVVAQAPRPRLTATNGVTVRDLENYLARQPGVSPQLAAEIKNIGDPNSTLPIPIPVDRFSAQHVRVQGVDGLLVGDNTGVGSGVIWQKDGAVYGVAGTLTQDQVVAIADGLH